MTNFCTCEKCGDVHVVDGPLWEAEIVPEIVPTQHCPVCWTYGHTHSKTCPHKEAGMTKHVKFL